MSDGKPSTPPTAGAGAGAASGCVAPCADDPCGKDAISNVTKCCGAEILTEAKKANGGKAVKIEFGTPAGGFDGSADLDAGKAIVKNTGNMCNDTETAFFEVANLAAKPAFDKAYTDASAGNLSREDFTRTYEKIEYENVQKALKAIDKCKKKWGCETYTFSFDAMRPAKNFDDHYKNYVSDAHKNYYRNAWDTNYKTAYDAKHPPPPTR